MEKKAAQPPPRLPRHGIWRTIDITRYVDGATFHLQASLAPNHIVKTEPLTDIHVEVRRKATKVIIPEAAASPIYPVEPLHCYILPGYLVREPDPPCYTNFPLRASLLCCPSTAPADYINWIPADIRIEEGRRDDLVSSMMNFLGEVVSTRRGEGYEFLTMHLSVTIEHNVIYSCGARRASPICIMTDSIEDEIRVEKKEKEEEKDMPVECAVCFEEVKLLRGHDFCCSWSVPRSGVQLCCSHVFHLSCIAPWLTNHDSCPMCRRPQHHFEFVVHYNP